MAKVSTELVDIFNKRELPDRDVTVLEKINIYIANNLASLTDGIINKVPKISAESRAELEKEYNISNDDLKFIKKTVSFSKMQKRYSNLKFGLILSYLKTGNRLFLLYLSVMIYASYITKYFPSGRYDTDIMKYTIDNTDNRTDFKKYQSLHIVLNKKIDTIESLFLPKLKKTGINDDLIIAVLHSISDRLNDMLKNITMKYMKNFRDPEVKIMAQYSTTKDGKNIISAAGVLSTVREKSVDQLMYISDKILRMLGYGPDIVNKYKYRQAFIKFIPESFGLMSKLTSEYLDEWMRRNKNNLTITKFKETFLSQMGSARGIPQIQKIVNQISDNIHKGSKKEFSETLNLVEVRKNVARYAIANIYFTSLTIL